MKEIALSRFEGFADIYDKFRPNPPTEIADILIQAYGNSEVDTLVDLGCGTGLSTIIWMGKAKRIIGIEPNEDMR